MLKIGYLIQDFPPEVGAGPARATEMALRWQMHGAQVTIITGMPNRRMPGLPDGSIHPDYRGRLFLEEERQGLRVLRSWVFATPRRGFAWTLANNTSFMVTAAINALRRAGDLDILIVSSPPFFVNLAGEAIRRIRKIPVVLEIRDLWPDYLVQMGVVKGRRAQRALFGLERYLLERGNHSVVVTDSFRWRVIDKGVAPERVSVIPNGVDTDQYHYDDAKPPIPEMERRQDEFVVGYLGTFGAGQRLRTVVEAAALLRERAPEIRFVLAGDGADRAEITGLAAELGLDNISIHPPLPKEETRAFYNSCDLCLVPLAPIPVFQETIPSKIFEVMACERPILASLAGEAAEIVARSGAGMVSPPGDAQAMAEGITRLLALDGAERREMGRRGREYVERHYNREALADEYLRILFSVAGRSFPAKAKERETIVSSGAAGERTALRD